MRSILEEFACGNISTEPCFSKDNAPYQQALRQAADSEEKLLAALNEYGKELFEAYSEAQSELDTFYNISRFVTGYRLGVLMTMEVFNGDTSR